MLATLLNNQMLVLLFTLGLGGLITTTFWYAFNMFKEYLTRRMITSVVIENLDPVYKWLLQFLIQNGYLADRMSDCIVKVVKPKRNWWEPKKQDKKTKVEYYPAPGMHYFTYKGKKMWAVQDQGKVNLVGYDNKPEVSEKIVIMCYGSDTGLIQELIDDAVVFSMDQDKGLLGIYQVLGWICMWMKVMTKKARSLDSVVLDTDVAETLVKDIENFQESGEWYLSKGVPYRRGYLLYGPPGTGKTSFVQAVAGALKLNLCYLNLSSGDLDDDQLNRLLSEAPERSIILLEDVDAMFVQRDQVSRQKLSFSGFLNALDGVRSQEGQILFMTTNHKERLDPALLRPGRADVHVNLNNASEKQIKGLFSRFYPNEADRAQEFANKLPVFKISMAKLQGHMLQYRDSADVCIEKARDLVNDDSNMMLKEMSIDEWLHRLNLLDLKPAFEKQKIRRVADLKHIQAENMFYDYTICTDKLKVRRLWNMMIGEQETKDMFKYLSKHGIRGMASVFLSDQKALEELLSSVPEDTITGFHLKDIFDTSKSKAELRRKLYDCILFNKRFPKSLEISKQFVKEKEEEKKDDKKKIEFDLTKFFTDLNALDCINKLQKQDLNDPELFFKVEIATIESALELKPEGKKLRIMKKIKEVREKFEKDGKISYIDAGLLENVESPPLRIVKSNTRVEKRNNFDE